MNVIKEKSREYKGKNYYKYKIIIPERILSESGISEKDELEAIAYKGKIEIKKK
jgi:bifunctional DNA-binding transcriptional regulator/antitoxin component of YhaV-PrlF toxin-antitoxin module